MRDEGREKKLLECNMDIGVYVMNESNHEMTTITQLPHFLNNK